MIEIRMSNLIVKSTLHTQMGWGEGINVAHIVRRGCIDYSRVFDENLASKVYEFQPT